MRFTHRIQAIKLNLHYHVGTCRRVLVARQLGITVLRYYYASIKRRKIELQLCCYVTQKSKAKVKQCTERKLHGICYSKRVL